MQEPHCMSCHAPCLVLQGCQHRNDRCSCIVASCTIPLSGPTQRIQNCGLEQRHGRAIRAQIGLSAVALLLAVLLAFRGWRQVRQN